MSTVDELIECLDRNGELVEYYQGTQLFMTRLKVEGLEAKLALATEALKFYADEEMWSTFVTQGPIFDGFVDGDFCDAFSSDWKNNRQDSGQTAREALKELKK